MSADSRAPSVRSGRLISIAPALVAGLALAGACFDSDEKVQAIARSTTSGVGATTFVSTTSTSGMGSTSTGEPDVTCRDAIQCVVDCAGELAVSKLPEPDLTCFLECEEGLTVSEALKLFRLAECVTNKCIDAGVCEKLEPSDSTSSSSSSSDGGSSSSSGSDSGTSTGGSSSGSVQPENPCLDCVLANMLDPQPPGCLEFASVCV